MAEDRIIPQMNIPHHRQALPAREPWPEVGVTLFADDREAARDHGSFDGPTSFEIVPAGSRLHGQPGADQL
jgi:hypothetical protein